MDWKLLLNFILYEEPMGSPPFKSAEKSAILLHHASDSPVVLLLLAAMAMARPIRDSGGEVVQPQDRAPVPPSGRNPCTHVHLPGDGRHCL
ncbi:unnamed protein product [Citrullus colocynthis]|uniref:Uncharacterized protein n=1 Tax=Citrullus colocynthis TaxID=252529 RepID=A0ABP0XQ84_9ROSI